MQKFVASLGVLSAGLFLTSIPVLAQASFHITSGQTVTTKQTLGSGGSTGQVDATGTLSVTGNNVAITATGNATITNSGTIQQTSVLTGGNAGNGRAIRDNTGGLTLTVTNNLGALIQTADGDDIQMNKAGSTVTFYNYGAINSLNSSAAGNQAIDWNALNTTVGSNTLYNYSTGVITASEADAVRPGVNGVIYNSGTIKSTTATGSSSDGIDAQTNSGITITNAAATTTGAGATNLIEGGRHGITGGNTTGTGVYTMTVTNNLGGTIQGDNGSGINIDGIGVNSLNGSGTNSNEVVTITNAGTITGNGHNINDGNAHDGDGVDVDGLVNLSNSGTIKSLNAYSNTASPERSEGVTVGGGTIVNSGTIEGSVTSGNTTAIGVGITLAGVDKDVNNGDAPFNPPQAIYGNSSVTNNSGGLIKGDSASGIAIEGIAQAGFSTFTVIITNNANASIVGGGTTDAAIEAGVTTSNTVATANNLTIINSGTIDGSSSGKAIDFGSGANNLTIEGTSAQVYGNITGGSGTNTVKVDTGASFNYAGTLSKVGNLTVAANSNLAAGGTQPAPVTNGTQNAANGNLTFDTTGLATGSTIMNITSANLTFALGTGDANSGSKIMVAGGVLNTIAFSGADTVTINDLVGANLTLNQEYVLISDGADTVYNGLQLDSTVTSLGQKIDGGLSLASGNTFSQLYGNSQLYYLNGNIEIEVAAAPEPKSWMLGLIAVMAGVFIQVRRRRLEA